MTRFNKICQRLLLRQNPTYSQPSKPKLYVDDTLLFFAHREGTCHGVALWMDVHLDADNVVTSGAQTPVTPGTIRPQFDPYTRQGVYFLVPQVPVTSTSTLVYSATFNCTSGEMDIRFDVEGL